MHYSCKDWSHSLCSNSFFLCHFLSPRRQSVSIADDLPAYTVRRSVTANRDVSFLSWWPPFGDLQEKRRSLSAVCCFRLLVFCWWWATSRPISLWELLPEMFHLFDHVEILFLSSPFSPPTVCLYDVCTSKLQCHRYAYLFLLLPMLLSRVFSLNSSVLSLLRIIHLCHIHRQLFLAFNFTQVFSADSAMWAGL